MIAAPHRDAEEQAPRCASSTGPAAASASPTPTTSPWCATSSPSWSPRDCVPRAPGTRRSEPGRTEPPHRSLAAGARPAPPAPLVTGRAPDGRRVPDREPVETIDGTLAPQGYRLEMLRRHGARGRRGRRGPAPRAVPRWPSCAIGANAPDGPARRHAARPVGSRTGPTSPCAASCSTCPATACRTLQTLIGLVDRLASWKINQLQLYMEHTFAYAGHEDVLAPRRSLHRAGPRRPRRPLPLARRGARRQPEHPRPLRAMAAVRPLPAARHRPRRLRLGLRHPPSRPDPGPGQPRGVRARLGPPRPAGPPTPQQAGPHRHGRAVGARAPSGSGEWAQWLRALRELPVLAGPRAARVGRRARRAPRAAG